MVNKNKNDYAFTTGSENIGAEEKIYLNYINMLIKTENLQNKLEKAYTKVMNTTSEKSKNISSETVGLNNCLNKLLVKVMILQNVINLITLNK